MNLNCGDTYLALLDAVKQGLVTETEIDASLAILLRTRFKLGLFDPAEANPYNRIPVSTINSPAHRALARSVAEKSLVLLKNNGALPLKDNLPKYFVTGPNAAGTDVLMGNYFGVNGNLVTILEGLASHVRPGSQLQYKQGVLLDRDNINPIDWTTGDARSADAVVVVLGISGLLEGEEGESIASPSAGDRLDYTIPGNQVDFLRKLKVGNPHPVIAVITGGSPMNLAAVQDLADAVLLVWYPGEEGGNAVADVIFGKVSPSGKLPVTFPKSLDQLPDYSDYSMKGRTYRYMSAEPLYPFGFGLSYTTFGYSDLILPSAPLHPGQPLQVSVTVSNTGFGSLRRGGPALPVAQGHRYGRADLCPQGLPPDQPGAGRTPAAAFHPDPGTTLARGQGWKFDAALRQHHRQRRWIAALRQEARSWAHPPRSRV